MDALSVIDKLREYLVRFPDNYYNLIFSPKAFFISIKELPQAKNQELITNIFLFAIICLLIGASVGGYMNLSGGPQLFDFEAIIFVLFLWFATAIILHPFLLVFGATGDVSKTLAVVILATSGLHIIWIPIFSLVSNIITETRVVLTYNYAISYSIASKDGEGRGRMWGEGGSLAYDLIANYTESYVAEQEPEKEGSILPPANSEVARERVPIAISQYPKPERYEEAIVGPHSTPLLRTILATYVFSHIYYFGVGFSQVHGKSKLYWILLAFIIPVSLTALFIGAIILYAWIVYF